MALCDMEITNMAQRATSVQKREKEDLIESCRNLITAIRNAQHNRRSDPMQSLDDILDLTNDFENHLNGI